MYFHNLFKINNGNNRDFQDELETYINVLEFNCEILKNKIKLPNRAKNDLIDSLYILLKSITKNLDVKIDKSN